MTVTLDDKCAECGATCFDAEWIDVLRNIRQCKKKHKHRPWHDVCCSLSQELPTSLTWHHSQTFACFPGLMRDGSDDYEQKPNKHILRRYKIWLKMQTALLRQAARDLK